MKFTFKRLIIFILFISSISVAKAGNNQKNGTIVKFTIEGAEYSELNKQNKSREIQQLEEKVYSETISWLKAKYALDTIETIQKKPIIRKNGLNRLVGVRGLKKKEIAAAANAELTFKVKCDISFDSSIGVELLVGSNTRAIVYLAIGVFKNGKLQEVLKADEKTPTLFIGDTSEAYLNSSDFEETYLQALIELR